MKILGIDPDSDKYGVAFYQGGELISLHSLGHVDLISKISDLAPDLVSIENVMANNFVYTRNNKGGKAQVSKIAMCIGRCQNSQKVLMEWLDDLKIPYVLHSPQRGNWAKDKAMFERATKWDKRSNEDTRSAAYFGFLEANRKRI